MAVYDRNCSQRHKRMKVWPRSSRNVRYSSKSIASATSLQASPGPIPSWRLCQMWEPVRYTARSSGSSATVK